MQYVKLKEDSIVLMCGAMGTGKSTLCEKIVDPHHIVSTDKVREEFSGDFQDMRYNDEVFEIVYCIIEQRAKAGMFTVIDSTASNGLVNRVYQIAQRHGRPVTVLKMPELSEDQVTEERMKHRMGYIHAYYRQVNRIREQRFPNAFTVIDIEDPDRFRVEVQNQFKVDLPSGYIYTIIPDVHGEHHLVQDLIDKTRNEKFIFLGDLVDRGRSSYQTFVLIRNLVDDGLAHVVPGNHDNKLMRYFKKWLKDDNPNKYKLPDSMESIPTYGMKLAHGLSGTLMEFYQLGNRTMDMYASDFVDFYNKLPPFLRMEGADGNTHFFAHAGVPKNAIEGKPLTKGDMAAVLYQTMNLEDFEAMGLRDNVVIHLGHEVPEEGRKLQMSDDGTLYVFKHDLGMGKEDINSIVKGIARVEAT